MSDMKSTLLLLKNNIATDCDSLYNEIESVRYRLQLYELELKHNDYDDISIEEQLDSIESVKIELNELKIKKSVYDRLNREIEGYLN